MPLFGADEERALAEAKESLGAFAARFEAAYMGGLRRKIGLRTEREGDAALVRDLLTRMAVGSADFTLTFRHLCEAVADPDADARVGALFTDPAAYDAWAAGWRARLALEPDAPESRRLAMRQVNPAFIPRNHRVEAVIDAAVRRQDFAPFEELLDVLARPFEDRLEFARYTEPPGRTSACIRLFAGREQMARSDSKAEWIIAVGGSYQEDLDAFRSAWQRADRGEHLEEQRVLSFESWEGVVGCPVSNQIRNDFPDRTLTHHRHCEPPLGDVAIQGAHTDDCAATLDCHVAKRLLAMTKFGRVNPHVGWHSFRHCARHPPTHSRRKPTPGCRANPRCSWPA